MKLQTLIDTLKSFKESHTRDIPVFIKKAEAWAEITRLYIDEDKTAEIKGLVIESEPIIIYIQRKV